MMKEQRRLISVMCVDSVGEREMMLWSDIRSSMIV